MEANPLLANKVLEGVVRVITLTGDRTGVSRKADTLFKDRHWQSIQRINCRGRQAPVFWRDSQLFLLVRSFKSASHPFRLVVQHPDLNNKKNESALELKV